MTCKVGWKRVMLVYILQIYSSTASAVAIRVHLEVPKYVNYRSTVTLFCDHNVSENILDKIEFIRNGQKIFQYIKDRNPPIIESRVTGAEIELTKDMRKIKLKNIGFEAAGEYSCDVSMATPIYTAGSNVVDIQVIVPQNEDPQITFKKRHYNVGEILEANCTSSPARPAPHLTWFINGKEVDVSLLTPFPSQPRGSKLSSSTSQLSIEVSSLHAGDNGHLEISCNSTIPNYPMNNGQYADCKSVTKSIKIIPSHPPPESSSQSYHQNNFVLSTISVIIAIYKVTDIQSIFVKLLDVNCIVL